MRNLPVDLASGYAGISTMFDLNNRVGERVNSLSLSALLSDLPLATYAGGSASPFSLAIQENNAQGAGGGKGQAMLPCDRRRRAAREPLGDQLRPARRFPAQLAVWPSEHRAGCRDACPRPSPTVCNGLKTRKAWSFPTRTESGIRDNNCGPGTGRDCSLVGKLDMAMNNTAGASTGQFGARFHQRQAGLHRRCRPRRGADHQAQGTPGIRLRDSETSPDGNAESKTEDGTRRSLVQWVIDEIRHGEDVEVRIGWDGGGGHMIDIIGGGEESWVCRGSAG